MSPLGPYEAYEPLVLAVLVGLVPAAIARHKGYNFFVWWACGTGLFVLVLPLALWIRPDRSRGGQPLPPWAYAAVAAFALAFGAFAVWGP